MEEQYDTVIIGAGISGLSVGTLLAKAGKRILVVEQMSQVGGRATTVKFEIEGEQYLSDVGTFHSLPMRHTGSLAVVYDNGPGIEKLNFGLTDMEPGWRVYRKGGWEDMRQMNKGPNREDYKKIIFEVVDMKWEDIDQYDTVGFGDWIMERTDKEDLHDWFRIIGNGFTTLVNFNDMSAAECIFCMKESLEKMHAVSTGCFRIGGSIGYSLDLVDHIRQQGVEVLTSTKVNEIVTENGKVRGVRIAEVYEGEAEEPRFVEAPLVVYSAPIWHIFDVISEDEFPSWFTRIVKSYTSPSVLVSAGRMIGWRSVISAEAIARTEHIACIEMPHSGLYHQGGFPGLLDSSLAPPGKMQFEFLAIGDDSILKVFQDKRRLEELYVALDKDFKLLYPEIRGDVILWKRRLPVGVVPNIDGLSRMPYYTGNFRLDHKSPIEGLYLTGDTVKGRGVGMDTAARSGILCANKILGAEFPTMMP